MNNIWITDHINNICNVEYGTRVVNRKDGGSIYPVYGSGSATFFMDIYNREDRFIIARFAMSEQCVRFVNGKFFLNDSGITLSPKDNTKIDQRFLDYQCLSMNNLFYSLAKGSAQKNLDVPAFRKLALKFPKDLATQKKIVAKLDKIFAEIDKAYELLNKKIKIITFLRESFLEEKLKKINSNVEISIDEFCYTTDYVANGSFASLAANVKYLNEEDYAILVRLTDYRKNFKSKLKYITKKSYDFLKHSKLFEGDLILTNVGAYCGTPFLIPKLNKPATLGPNAVLIRPKKEIMSSEFLKIFFESRKGQNLLEAISTGTSHKKFNKTSLRRLKIPIPTTDQQSKILDEINNLNKRICIIEQHTENKLKNFEFLKQSILKQAFNGELVKAA